MAAPDVLFRIKCKKLTIRGIPFDSYLKCSFDNFWEHKTSEKPKGKDTHTWEDDIPEFTYATRQPQRLSVKEFIVEVWEHNSFRKDALKATAKIDLYSIFTGPAVMEMQVVSVEHAVLGSITVEMDAIQVTNSYFELRDVVVDLDDSINAATLEYGLASASAALQSTPLVRTTANVFTLSEARSMGMPRTIYDVIPQAITLSVKTGCITSCTQLPAHLFYSFTNDSKPFEADLMQWSAGTATSIVGTISGNIALCELPQYIQMPGGVRNPGGIGGGVFYLPDVPKKPTCRVDLDTRYRGALISAASPPAGGTVTSLPSNVRANSRQAAVSTSLAARPAPLGSSEQTAADPPRRASVSSEVRSAIPVAIVDAGAPVSQSPARALPQRPASPADPTAARVYAIAAEKQRLEDARAASSATHVRANATIEDTRRAQAETRDTASVAVMQHDQYKSEVSDLQARSERLQLLGVSVDKLLSSLSTASATWRPCPEKDEASASSDLLRQVQSGLNTAIQQTLEVDRLFAQTLDTLQSNMSQASIDDSMLEQEVVALKAVFQASLDVIAEADAATGVTLSQVGSPDFDSQLAALSASIERVLSTERELTSAVARLNATRTAIQAAANTRSRVQSEQISRVVQAHREVTAAEDTAKQLYGMIDGIKARVEELSKFVPPACAPSPAPHAHRHSASVQPHMPASTPQISLPRCWVRCIDPTTNKLYFQNEVTKLTAWDLPTEPEYDAVWHYPGPLGITLVEMPFPEMGPGALRCELQVTDGCKATANAEMLGVGHFVVAVNGFSVRGAPLDYVQSIIRDSPRPMSIRFRNPFAVPPELAAAAKDPKVLISPPAAAPMGFPGGGGPMAMPMMPMMPGMGGMMSMQGGMMPMQGGTMPYGMPGSYGVPPQGAYGAPMTGGYSYPGLGPR